jgi:hypothetical protein
MSQVLGEWRYLMRRFTVLSLVWMLLAVPTYSQSGFTIELKQKSRTEQQTKDQLERLLRTYDIQQWIFTKSILIDDTAIPHSHPVLSLSTRHIKDDELLLSTFIHEQFHWWASANNDATQKSIAELRAMFPKVPVGAPEGAVDENSTYLHLVVCYLEYRAMRELLGEFKSRQIMDFWATDHYTWIYRTVLEKPREISTVLFKYKLLPVTPH